MSQLELELPAITQERRFGERTSAKFEWPDIRHAKEVALDTETTGRAIYEGSEAVGFSVYLPEGSWYFPFGHRQGANLDPDRARQWALDNLAGKVVRFAESKFDLHAMRKFGVDLETIGARPRDVQFDCALLNSRRRSYKLNDMAKDFLGKQKIRLPQDGLRIYEKKAEDVAEYARVDAQLTWELGDYFQPLIDREQLGEVQKLENDIIYAVASMERGGLLVDMERLHEYRSRCLARYQRKVLELEKMMGFRVTPGKRDSMTLMMQKLSVHLGFTPTGGMSFAVEELEKHDDIPEVRLLKECLQLDSLDSKFFDKIERNTSPDGYIRYKLNQLKAEGEEEEQATGAVTGRFSASGFKDKEYQYKGFNPQQTFKVKEQMKSEAVKDLVVKDIFVAPEGMDFWSSDASQIEYRIFGHYANSENVTKVYQRNPRADFHDLIADMCKPDWRRTDPSYRDIVAKHANLAKIFGAGLKKFAYMVDMTIEEARPINDLYDRMFPEARRLLAEACRIAETRGYVMTLMKRRRRFGPGIDEKYYAALNAAIQGTAADINKLTIRDLYNARKELGIDLRLTYHDEELGYGYLKEPETRKRLEDFMNVQRLKLRVPILWDLKVGRSWNL